MGAKNAVIDLIKSDEIREYLQDMFDQQTDRISNLVATQRSSEMEQLVKECEALKEKIGNFEIEISIQNQENDILRQKNKEVSDKLEESEDSLKKLIEESKEQQSKIEIIEKEKKDSEEQLQQRIAAVSKELEVYKNNFELASDIMCIFTTLSEDTVSRLRNVLGNGSIYDLLVKASEWRNIEVVWEYTKRRIIEQDHNDDNEKLKALMVKLIEVNQSCTNGRGIEIIVPGKGEKFDSDVHSIVGIDTDGVISKVLLFGIRDKITKKTIYKALVKVE